MIEFILSNFTLSFFVLGIVVSTLLLLKRRHRESCAAVVEVYFSYFLLFSVGFSYLYNFVMHVFFADMAAAFIGWAPSPFQYEVGFASLGFAAVGFMAFRASWSFRLAAIMAPSLFLWGDAVGHVYQMVVHHDFSPGNAGIIFWTDIFLPIISFVFILLQRRCRS